MRIKNFFYLFFIVLFLALSFAAAFPQEKRDEGQVNIPWDEFIRLLELDKDEILLSWEEFQKILAQTGNKYVPSFQMKDEKILLTREQFKTLLNQMRSPDSTVIQPPADYLITKAAYIGRITETDASFTVVFDLEVFERQRSQYVKIPLFPRNVALRNIFLNGEKGIVVIENNQITLATDRVGKHQITVHFSVKTDLKQGPRAISLPIPMTPITSLEIDIPFTDIEVDVPNAQQIEVSRRGNSTKVLALLSSTNSINVNWRKSIPEAEKGSAKVYADLINHIVVEDDALRINSTIALSILQNTIPSLILRVPEGYSILDVQGNGLGDWREVKQGDMMVLEIPFEYPKQGNFSLTVMAEKILSQTSMAIDFSGFAVVDAIREKGFLGIELKGASQITLTSADGLDKLDVSELPAELIGRSQKPLLFGFKYLHHPYLLVLDIKKHEEIPVISTVIDSASGVTLFTEDGKLVNRLIFKVRNTSKQFLELALPAQAEIWSVFVGGEPARPRLNENKILIPLNRSQQGATGLAAFDVELIYFIKAKRFGRLGRRESLFPVPDIIISQMLWSVYLPEGYSLLYFGGTVEKEKFAKGIRPLLGTAKRFTYYSPAPATEPEGDDEYRDKVRNEASKLKGQFSANLALSEEQLTEQVKNEARFGQRVQDIQEGKVPLAAGVLPIRIQIPTTGQLFRFAKTIISEDVMTMNFTFISQGMLTFIKVLLVLLIAIVFYSVRRKIKALFTSLRIGKQMNQIPIMLLVLGVIALVFSKLVAILLIMASLVAFIYGQIMKFRKEKEERKTDLKS
ncbi:MAG: hypothetical protein MUP98_21240 [Candidatus Aminicenantes bacterium]|nr:hypothetical protein [Candidatus Aminicenantes bacterium]